MKRHLALICLLAPYLPLFAQSGVNLIPNPSFEEMAEPSFLCQQAQCGGNLECAEHWINPTNDTPDFIHEDHYNCTTGNGLRVTAPNNWAGYQYARTGKGYIALHTYTTVDDAEEFAVVKLLDTLDVGRTYRFTMYVSKAENRNFTSNGLGITLFEDEGYMTHDCCDLNSPSIWYVEEVIDDEVNWVEYSGTFVAEHPSVFLGLGRFISDYNMILVGEPPSGPLLDGATYFIDDVSLVAEPIPPLEFGDDLLVCGGFVLKSPMEADSYSWSTGATSSAIEITQSGEYWLEIERFGETRRDSVYVSVMNNNRIFPSPSNGHLTLELASETETETPWRVLDMTGRLVASGRTSVAAGTGEYDMDLSHLSSGVYLLWLDTPCGDKSLRKIVVAR